MPLQYRGNGVSEGDAEECVLAANSAAKAASTIGRMAAAPVL
jgi:hypothetical protein